MKYPSIVFFFQWVLSLFSAIALFVYLPFIGSKKRTVIFGTSPVINIKYWSEALKDIHVPSQTLVKGSYSIINKNSDFDLLFSDILPFRFRWRYFNEALYPFFVFRYILQNAKFVVFPFHGIVFKRFWKWEYYLLKSKGIKTIIAPYGSDVYMYSRIRSKSLQHVLLADYLAHGKNEATVKEKVNFWSRKADIVLPGLQHADGMPVWHVAPHNFLCISPKKLEQQNQGSNENKGQEILITHAPNHRMTKGSEFIIHAVEELKNEGYNVRFNLIEKMQNEEVLEQIKKSDIVIDQIIIPGHGLFAVEAMSLGVPVIANLEDEDTLKVCRRYSFLDECPILSATPENIKEQIKLLIENKNLRKELGTLGHKYVEKYHSYTSAQYLFGNIFKKLEGEDIDLMNLYHPLKSKYVKTNYIHTPLKNNKYVGPAC